MNKMQRISIAFVEVNLHIAQNWRTDLNLFCKDTFMWPSVDGNVLTNQTDVQSEKTHEVTRCKQPYTTQIPSSVIIYDQNNTLN